MKKILCVVVTFSVCGAFAEADLQPLEKLNVEKTANEEFSDLSEPCRNVTGAYYGIGLGLSRISHSVNAVKNSGTKVDFKKNDNQYDLSLIGGFGAAFYKEYYAGIELEFFKRFKGKTAYNGEVGVIFPSAVGLNMDVRFGYLFPEHGSLVYMTAGFARIQGKVAFENTAQVRRNASNPEGSFGSFYPTFGLGIEHKVNHNWNVRGDFRVSVTSKDDNKYIKANAATTWKYDAKPNRMSFRISVTRSV